MHEGGGGRACECFCVCGSLIYQLLLQRQGVVLDGSPLSLQLVQVLVMGDHCKRCGAHRASLPPGFCVGMPSCMHDGMRCSDLPRMCLQCKRSAVCVCCVLVTHAPAGFSEEQLVQLADSLRPAIIPAPRPYYQVGWGGGAAAGAAAERWLCRCSQSKHSMYVITADKQHCLSVGIKYILCMLQRRLWPTVVAHNREWQSRSLPSRMGFRAKVQIALRVIALCLCKLHAREQ